MKIKKVNTMRCEYISSTTGRPSKDMSDDFWQRQFEELRAKTPQSIDSRMRKASNPLEFYAAEYKGLTQFQQYCSYINSILRSIRSGETDYCHYIYQIQDLLKYEHSNLKTKYLPKDQCWEVYLLEGERNNGEN